jgi:hypothetical protein
VTPPLTAGRLLRIAAAAVVLACCLAIDTDQAPTPLSVGVLSSRCTDDRAAAVAAAGIRTAVLSVPWARYEPQPGVFDAGYAQTVRAQVQTCESHGIGVILAPGLQYPPRWVLAMPGGQYRDQDGHTPTPAVANLAFSAAVRAAATDYLARLGGDLGLNRFRAVRIGTTSTGEIGYPGPNDGGGDGSFWAFDAAAQSGAGLAAGIAPNPLPGWRPGTGSWRGSRVTPAQVTDWFGWYRDAPTDALAWQLTTLRGLGYRGPVHVPVAGRGVLPMGLAEALAGHLQTAGTPNGALERGLDYPAQFRALAALDRRDRDSGGGGIAVDFTGFDDTSAVRARALAPPQDACRAGDTEAASRAGLEVGQWSNQRWTTANARLVGLSLVGENPGPPDGAHTGGGPNSDSTLEQLQNAPAAARACGAVLFLWAFEDTLFDGRYGTPVTALSEQVREVK